MTTLLDTYSMDFWLKNHAPKPYILFEFSKKKFTFWILGNIKIKCVSNPIKVPTSLRFGSQHVLKICQNPFKSCSKRPPKIAPFLALIFYRFKVPLYLQFGPNLDPKMALELPKSRPRGAYRSPKRPLGTKNRPYPV